MENESTEVLGNIKALLETQIRQTTNKVSLHYEILGYMQIHMHEDN